MITFKGAQFPQDDIATLPDLDTATFLPSKPVPLVRSIACTK